MTFSRLMLQLNPVLVHKNWVDEYLIIFRNLVAFYSVLDLMEPIIISVFVLGIFGFWSCLGLFITVFLFLLFIWFLSRLFYWVWFLFFLHFLSLYLLFCRFCFLLFWTICRAYLFTKSFHNWEVRVWFLLRWIISLRVL
jgi:hypothetical protein